MNPESAVSRISPERLKKYADFVEVHSDLQPDGTLVYNPEKALVGLLSILTPDPKGIVLAGMQDEVIYLSDRQLYSSALDFLEKFGYSRSAFPLKSVWGYCELNQNNIKCEGSLVKVGAVVIEVITHEDLDTYGYIRSEAGRDLGISLFTRAVEFVNRAEETGIHHKFDSLGRILGSVNSATDIRRPWVVYNVIKFLVNNSGSFRKIDIFEGIKGENIHLEQLGHTLFSLGNAGIIDYLSPLRDSGGKKGKGWVKYRVTDKERLKDFDKLYEDVRRVKGYFRDRTYLKKVIQRLSEKETLEFDLPDLENNLKISHLGSVLTALSSIGIIQHESKGFISQHTQSRAQANDLTKMFYDLVLLPAVEEASFLTPLPIKEFNSNRISNFLNNYREERSYAGRQGGEELREKILLTLLDRGEMKLSYIAQIINDELGRGLRIHSVGSQLTNLISQGLVEKTKRSFYRLKENTN